MNTNIEVLRELDELVEAARLLGATQAKRGFGCYTDEDSRFERAMHESIAKHRAALTPPAITRCDNCGCDWLDNGLNPIGCPYCELRRETERRWEGNRRAAQEYVEDMRDVLKEAAQVCKDLDDEALAKESRLACGAECAAAIAELAVRWNVPFERT